ncbi:MAG: ribose-phosphate diphosphokinase [Acidobacteriia bacterium]|nr:ribose-phosphate diphosphokinase [Terriglobia bacterium]
MAARLSLFSLRSGEALAERVARNLGIRPGAHEERDFEWGQHKTRPLESVRGSDVYVVQSLHGEAALSVNDKLCRLLFFLGALRDAGADRVTAVVPFLCYARKEQRTKPRDPVITRYVASIFEAVGVECVVTVEVHNVAAFQNAFRCRTEHLDAGRVFAEYFATQLADQRLAVVSPDFGGIKRAERFRDVLSRRMGREIPGGFIQKRRSEGVVSGDAVVGDVEGRTILLIDDMISGGTTIARAATACRRAGALKVVAAAAHGAFVPEAASTLAAAPIDRIAVLDHIPPAALPAALVSEKLWLLDSAALLAEAIRRLHEGGSLTDLLEG